MPIVRQCIHCGKDFFASRGGLRRYCSRDCNFDFYVDRDGPVPGHVPELGPCWVWTGARKRRGYGAFHRKDDGVWRPMIAHRFALERELGREIAPGLCALHKCDNPPCCRGSHLFEGSTIDNVHDRDAKGRTGRTFGDENPSRKYPDRVARGDRNSSVMRPWRLPRGERVHCAKLTAGSVAEIRRRHAQGERSREIAKSFGVTSSAIVQVVSRRTWKHVA